MPTFYNRPEFRQGITQHIGHALRLSKGETVHFKNRGRGRRPTVDISVEILKYASKCPEWYKRVSEEDVGAALENERSIAGIMIIAKAKALSHWRKAVTSSKVVSEFIGSNEKHFIRGDPIEGIITGYPPYQTLALSYFRVKCCVDHLRSPPKADMNISNLTSYNFHYRRLSSRCRSNQNYPRSPTSLIKYRNLTSFGIFSNFRKYIILRVKCYD